MHSTALPRVVDDIWYLVIAILTEPAPTPDNSHENNHARHPNFTDLLALSSASKGLRNLLAPRLFRTLDLHNNAKSASSVLAVSQGSLARHVKELRYTITCAPDLPFEELYPPALDSVLTNLSQFPALEKLGMIFPQDRRNDLIWDNLWDFANDNFVDDAAEAADEEKATPWRGTMASSYRTIASNYNSNIDAAQHRSLDFSITNLPLVTASTFSSPQFHTFLSQLNSFTLSLPHLNNGVGWSINTQEIYPGFVDNLPFWFFDHLSSIESFTFDPRETGILGAWQDRYRTEIGIFQANMPNLRRLELANVAVCEELSDFVIRHKGTLEVVILRDCHAGERPGSMSWADLFTAVAGAELPRLREVDVQDEGVEVEIRDSWRDDAWVKQRLIEVRSQPGVHTFAYGSLDDKYGFLRVSLETVYRRFLEGEDGRAFAEVLRVVERNRKNIG
ncbi:hypothetical protein BDW74DRAFT_172300 [Aspergillus multicolor]|uniref:uncharacterized protein n=1 Tax=Aspergillus multicolor TaxID=41759 RepID=UPI003CCCB17B